MDYKSLLNEQQLAPVYDTEGAVLVLAGAGSGKTRVLTYRIAYLIENKGVSPFNILAITFTNKAAGEMRERVEKITGREGMQISTFHSFCARILRGDADRLGYNSNFTIYDEADSIRVIKRVLKSMDNEDKDMPKTVRGHISKAKNYALDPEEYGRRISDMPDAPLISAAYAGYERELKLNNAMDFDDLLLNTVKLFSQNKDVLDKYCERYRYIHVDEFQDTNKIQYIIVRMLARKYGNIFVVGDDDQSIYGWRGAEIANIRDFRKNFPDARVYKLERNYRSTKAILELANGIIANNTSRMGKTLWTDGEQGVKVDYRACCDERSEADYVMEQISALMRHSDYKYSDFAILVRVNSITRAFEERLALYSMPFRVVGGLKFFERKEVKDFAAYLKLLVNPNDGESILRVINVPSRKIGDTSVAALTAACNARGISLFEGVMSAGKLGLPRAAAVKIGEFAAVINALREAYLALPLYEFIDEAANIIDFARAYDIDKDEDAGRLENIDDFKTAVKEFAKDNPDGALSDFLESAALISDADTALDGDCVTVATVHGVKGLEFRCVFVVGLEEGIFPTSRASTSASDLEEERRIMYVAITRAEERLYLTNAQSRFRFGKRDACLASRFLREGGFGKADADVMPETAHYSHVYEPRLTPSFARPQGTPPVQKDCSLYKVGMKVRHARFGEGEIIEITGENGKIRFPQLGVKMFSLRLAPIEIIA